MAVVLYFLTAFVRWIRLKIYQYEVTFAIYMLTPTEKFIFNTLFLALVTMIATGIYIYLPDHLRAIYGHLYYYWAGERPLMATRFPSINSVFGETTIQNLGAVYETAKNAATAANTPPAQQLVVGEL